MTNKEELREEWTRDLKDTKKFTKDVYNETFDWWLSKIEQIRKADMERVEKGIKDTIEKFINSWGDEIYPADRFQEKLLSIIKQDENKN